MNSHLIILGVMVLTACTVSHEGSISSSSSSDSSSQEQSSKAASFIAPLSVDRITKKQFGMYITPASSPVQPERFKGHHTGVDFEATEDTTDVSIKASCSGKVIYKNWVSGYGGVLIQACEIDHQPVTVLYGHLRLESISLDIGDELSQGKEFAALGTGNSGETDGERKHLHLSIHKGAAIDLKGYVQNQAELSGWMDPQSFF